MQNFSALVFDQWTIKIPILTVHYWLNVIWIFQINVDILQRGKKQKKQKKNSERPATLYQVPVINQPSN